MYKLFNKILFLPILFIGLIFCDSTFAFENPISINHFLNNNTKDTNYVLQNDFQSKSIRVLLSNKGAFEHKELNISSNNEIFITSNNQLVMNTFNPIKILIQNDYYLIEAQGLITKVPTNQKLLITTNNSSITISNIMKYGKVSAYLGNLEIGLSKSGKMKLINIVDIEDYLRGVVPNEMPVYFGLEALKAQSIAARGYAYRDASYKNADYDVCDTTGSQVYNGFNTHDAISDKAINDTMGQFALYDGKVILSLFSSTAGGYTENYENAFSQNGVDTKFPADPIPYLKGVPDFNYKEDLSREVNAKKFYTERVNSYETKSPKYRWEYVWTVAELENILAKNLIKYASTKFVTPKLKSKDDFGKLQYIDVPKRGVSGKAMYVRITTDKGVFLIAKEIMIRKIFTVDNNMLPSANIIFEKMANSKGEFIGYKVYGGGFGHGVGLSQFGAAGMAKAGFKYNDILKHYYTGISIGSYPVECNLKNINNCKTTFYSTNNKNAKLILQYSSKPSDTNFKINDNEVLLSARNFDKKSGQVDISKLLKSGINTVELTNCVKSSENNKIRFFVEIEGKDEK